MFDRWVEHRGLTLKEGRQSTLSQIRRIFDNDVLPSLGLCSISEISRQDLLRVLARIERRGALTTAEKCRTWFNQMFRFAMVKIPGLDQNPASDLDVVAMPKPPVGINPSFVWPSFQPCCMRYAVTAGCRKPNWVFACCC